MRKAVLVRARLLAKRRWRFILLPLLPLAGLGLYVCFAPFDPPEGKGDLPGTVIFDANGAVLQRDSSRGLRIPVRLDQIAPVMLEATISAEDPRFEEHPGIDPLAVGRALLTQGSHPSGASTITQQLARRLYLSDAGGPLLVRKGREALIALQLEAHRSKDEILALYLNRIYYGRYAYGVEAAARAYFGSSAHNLDLARASFLAGLPQLPSVFQSANGMDAAKVRQQYVLRRLREDGHISAAQAEAALAEPLGVIAEGDPAVARHFLVYAMDELKRVRPDLVGKPGLIIESTLDGGIQTEAEQAVQRQLAALSDKAATNAGVVVLEPATGRVLAMVGSANFDDPSIAGQVNTALERRQPGSALKPFLYAAAMERYGFTAATPLLDVPVTFQTPTGPYTPGNYDRRFHGVVPLRVALASSYNVPAVRTQDQIGIDALLDSVHRFGLNTLNDTELYGLALTLGGGEVRLLDMTAAYAAFANSGVLVQPFAIARIRDASGKVLYEHGTPASSVAVSPQVSYIVSDILSDPQARAPGFGQVGPLDLDFRAGVKTGTTTGSRDNWTIGFTRERAVGVWVGNSDGSEMLNTSGVDGAGPIWHDVMVSATQATNHSWIVAPPGLVSATVCSPTGELPGPDCPTKVEELFVAGTQPSQTEDYYQHDGDGRLVLNVPPEVRSWATDAGLALAQANGSSGSPGETLVRVVEPADGSVVYIAPELRSQQMVVRALASAPRSIALSLVLSVDGAPAASLAGADGSFTWRLEPGRHTIEAVATFSDGQIARTISHYEVRSP